MKKKLWIALLIIGIIPFPIALIYGIYNAFAGYSALCFWMCEYDYGFVAFRDSILLYSFIYWPTYIIGAILIFISIFKLRKIKKLTNNK